MDTPVGKKAAESRFPVVGIGASAGGMEAFGEFFQNMPPDSGMAFVVIQHLDPTRKGVMPELLQRMTPMKVAEVKDGLKVRPNCVYVIPPDRDISLLRGILHLSEPVAPRGLRLPIDFFFRHLAEDRRGKSIGIILSGMGTDGTMGIKAIKEAMGLAMAQDPASAKFDSMPRSAIDTGLVDYVAKAAELPAKLIAYARHAAGTPPPKLPLEKKAKNALEKIIILLRAHTAQDFSLYKKSTIQRRIERRMGVHQIDSLPLYVRFLEENAQEQDLLFKELLIGVTSFFRDQAAFAALQEKAIPALLKEKRAGGAIRIWVPGCSTGEEAYSIAIVLREALEGLKQKPMSRVQIFATDIDKDAIDKARQGVYPANIGTDVSAERLSRFFTKEDNGYRIKKEIREMLVFAPHNVFMDPPFTRLDLLSCRNLLIYLMPELQKNLLLVFHFCLTPRGILFLGPSETIGDRLDLFRSLDARWKLYVRLESAGAVMRAADMPFPYPPLEAETSINGREAKMTAGSLQDLTEKLLIQTYVPAAVLINKKGDILYIHGRTGNYLEPAAGKANMNVYAMAREGLRHELATALHHAIADNEAITAKNAKVIINGTEQFVDLTVKPFHEIAPDKEWFLVVFQEVAAPAKTRRSRRTETGPGALQAERITELEKELLYAREHLQTSLEEMQTTQEELKSSNEELQSTNEELQSTNEELTTSKEELQSVNEELLSVNAELQTKIEDLTHVTNDMKNLLESTEIATLFLDNDLYIKSFTPRTVDLIKLMPRDIGRPLTDITSQLDYAGLIDEVKEVLLTLAFKESEARTSAGQWVRVRIMPYRTYGNMIDGVVITFTDITALKKTEVALRQMETDLRHALEYAQSIIATIREPFLVLDEKMRVLSANASFYRTFQVKPEETEGKLLYDLGSGQWNNARLKRLLKELSSKKTEIHDFKVDTAFPAGGRKVLVLNARKLEAKDTGRQLILLAMEDRTV